MNRGTSKGQAAIEFILVVGAIMVIIMYTFPLITRHAELNKGIAAARDGAQFGAAMTGMGFGSTGGSTPGVIKLERVDYTIQDDSVIITIRVRGFPEHNTDAIKTTISDQAQRYIVKALTGEWKDIGDITASDHKGEYYTFNPINSSSVVWTST